MWYALGKGPALASRIPASFSQVQGVLTAPNAPFVRAEFTLWKGMHDDATDNPIVVSHERRPCWVAPYLALAIPQTTRTSETEPTPGYRTDALAGPVAVAATLQLKKF